MSRFHGVSTMPVTSVRDVEAHSVGLPPTRLDTQWPSSDDEPLLTVDPPKPVSGTLPTWVDSPRSQVNVPVRNVRPRLRLQSVPSTIDALEEDLEASAVSTVPASSRAVRRLLLVGRPCTPRARCRNSGDQQVEYTFIQNRFHPLTPLSSNNNFIQ